MVKSAHKTSTEEGVTISGATVYFAVCTCGWESKETFLVHEYAYLRGIDHKENQ